MTFEELITRDHPHQAPRLLQALASTPPVVSARLNRRRGGSEADLPAGVDGVVPWCPQGRYFAERPDFTHHPPMHQGVYYVQDASSMFLGYVVEWLLPQIALPSGEPLLYLDACAAPGGKTTAAIDALPDGSVVVANEFDYRRAEILNENLQKWGYPATIVSRGDTASFRSLPSTFHIIAADVPCSGEGMMRKDATARAQWSEQLVAECAARQDEILDNLWTALRPGGFLIYSTCTFNRTENDQRIARMVSEYGAEPVAVPVDPTWGIIADGAMLRFFPGFVRGEGLFLTVLRKPTSMESRFSTCGPSGNGKSSCAPRRSRSNQSPAKLPPLPRWLPDGYRVADLKGLKISDPENLRLLPEPLADTMLRLARPLYLIGIGIEAATPKGRDYAPLQPLALSMESRFSTCGPLTNALPATAFPTLEIPLPLALSYLRREALPGLDAPRGIVLLTFGGRPLGFANNLGNRANNLYPSPWRILH